MISRKHRLSCQVNEKNKKIKTVSGNNIINLMKD